MVLVLFSITAVSAFLVALVNDVTKETIAQTEQANKDKAKLEVLPAAKGTVTYEEKVREIGDFKVSVTKVMDDGELLGYAVEAPSIITGGYADYIYLMVGFVEDEAGNATIHGVKVLSQKETPGLGAEMIKPGNKLEKSILGKSAAELVFQVKKDDANGSFDALTGSTISSRAYTNAVETAYAGYLWATGQLTAKDSDETATGTAETDGNNTDASPDGDEQLDDEVVDEPVDEDEDIVEPTESTGTSEAKEAEEIVEAEQEAKQVVEKESEQPEEVVAEVDENKEGPAAQKGDEINE